MSVESIRGQTLVTLASLANSPRIAAIEEILAPLPQPFFAYVLRACIADLASNQYLISYIIGRHWQPFGMRADPMPDVLIDDVRVAFVVTRVERGETDAQIREAWTNLGKLGALVTRISPEWPAHASIPESELIPKPKPVVCSPPKYRMRDTAPRHASCSDPEHTFVEQLINDPTIDFEQRQRILESMHSSIANAAKPPSDEVRESLHEIVEEGPYDYAQRGIHGELAQACMDARGKPHVPLEGEEEDLIEKLSTEEIARWEKEIAEEQAKRAKQAQKAQKVRVDRARLDGSVPISGIYQGDSTVDMMKREVAEFRECLARDEEIAARDSSIPDPRMPKLGVKLGPQRHLVLARPPRDYTGDMASKCLEYNTTDQEVAAVEAAVRSFIACDGTDGAVAKAECKCDQTSAPAYADDTFNAYRRDLVYGDGDTTEAELQRMCAHKPKRPRKVDTSLVNITDDDVMREMTRAARKCLADDCASLARDEAGPASLAKISDEAIMREMMSRTAHVHDDTPEKPRVPPADVVEEMARGECAKALPDTEQHFDLNLARVMSH